MDYSMLSVLAFPHQPCPLAGQVENKYTTIPFIYNEIETIWLFGIIWNQMFKQKTLGLVRLS